jgi:hypothetical protein
VQIEERLARAAAAQADPAAVDLDETLAECHVARFAAAVSWQAVEDRRQMCLFLVILSAAKDLLLH